MTAPDIPTIEPTSVYAGDTVAWRKNVPGFRSDLGWGLRYTLVSSAARLVLDAAPLQGGGPEDWQVWVDAATTAVWAPGEYRWRSQAHHEQFGQYTLDEGGLVVRPAFDVPRDGRSAARQALDAIETYLQAPTNLAAARYSIAGRELQRYPIPDLWRHRDRLKLEVLREESAARAAAGLPGRGRVYVRFG